MKKQAPLKNKKAKHLEKPDPINKNIFLDYAKSLGLKTIAENLDKLLNYLDTLMLWNTRINLVGSLEWRTVFSELLMDSYYLKDFVEELNVENPNTWDLGSGAGLPGIPLRIFWEEGSYTLVEAREKRSLFMTNFLLKQPSKETKVFWGRAEDFFEEKRVKNEELADIIVSRAFMPYQELLKFVQSSMKKNARLILMLNEEHIDLGENVASWKLEKSYKYSVNIVDSKTKQERYFHAIQKI